MGQNEDELVAITQAPPWEAPNLRSLEIALGALERALGDLSQTDPDKWSGAAAQKAADAFDELRQRYGKVKAALADVRDAVNIANAARSRASEAVGGLPSGEVPSYVHQAVAAAQAAGEHHVVIKGYAYVADKAVSFFDDLLGHNREKEAQAALAALKDELAPEQQKLKDARERIKSAMSSRWALDDSDSSAKDQDSPDMVPGGPYPLPPLPRVPSPGPIRPPGEFSGPNPVPDPRTIDGPDFTDPIPNPGGPGWPPEVGLPSPAEPPRYGPGGPGTPSPGTGPGSGTGPYWPGQGPDVDSGSAGSIGSPGLTAGMLGGGALAGGAALRWASGAGAAGAGGAGAGGAGGAGGILGSGGVGGAGAQAGGSGMLAGGRGLAGGLPGNAAGAGSGAGASSGSGAGAGAGAGARGGMMAGAPGAGGDSGRKDQRSGLGGHIAPKLEDDEDFVPQSDSARAGSRDVKE